MSIVGRCKDLILSGGYNIYPKEIELIIDELNGVVESTVIGIPHSDFGESVAAVIVAHADAQLSEADTVHLQDRKNFIAAQTVRGTRDTQSELSLAIIT